MRCRGQVGHAGAQLGNGSATFFFAHVIQPRNAFFQGRGHLLLQSAHGVAVLGGVQGAGQLEHRVEIRFGADPELLGHFAEGPQISADEIAVDREGRAAAALQADRDLDMAAVQALFQHPAHFHLHRIEFAGQAQMEIEKAVVHRFQAESQGELIVHVDLHLRISGHGADVHGATLLRP